MAVTLKKIVLPAKAPTVPGEATERGLYNTEAPAQDDCFLLLRSDNMCGMQSCDQYIVLLNDFVKPRCHVTTISNVHGRAFGVEMSQIQKLPSKPKRSRSLYVGCPGPMKIKLPSLSLSLTVPTTHNYVTQREVLCFITANCRNCPTPQWIGSL
jgi:hypothetical protein